MDPETRILMQVTYMGGDSRKRSWEGRKEIEEGRNSTACAEEQGTAVDSWGSRLLGALEKI